MLVMYCEGSEGPAVRRFASHLAQCFPPNDSGCGGGKGGMRQKNKRSTIASTFTGET